MILCAGEALIDMLPRTSAEGEDAFAPLTGGAVFNTAIALGRLDVPVGLFTGLSTDLFGQRLEDALTRAGVDASMAARSDRPTTLAFVTLTDGHASYAFYDENTAGRMLQKDDLPTLPDTVGTLFFGGISLPVEPCGTSYEEMCLRHAADRVVMIDPNIRQTFITDETRYRGRLDRMISAADIVKVSDEDLSWITGHDDTDSGAGALLKQGARLVCVTRGGDGVSGYTLSGRIDVASERVEVVDTVGAGDTFNAGLLASLHDADVLTKAKIATLDEATIQDALSLGARAAAVTVSRAGANPPTRDELP